MGDCLSLRGDKSTYDFRSIEDCLLDLHIQEVQKIEGSTIPVGSSWSSHLMPSSNLLRLLCLHRTRQNPKLPVSRPLTMYSIVIMNREISY